jgi:hypothetical protein
MGDKWNRSRLYGTWIALAGLGADAGDAQPATAEAFLRYQHDDGGWGCFGRSTLSETAFGLLALSGIATDGGGEGRRRTEITSAIGAAHSFLRRAYNAPRIGEEHMWVCKDLYSARRIDQGAVLAALLAPCVLPHLQQSRRRRAHMARELAVAA